METKRKSILESMPSIISDGPEQIEPELIKQKTKKKSLDLEYIYYAQKLRDKSKKLSDKSEFKI